MSNIPDNPCDKVFDEYDDAETAYVEAAEAARALGAPLGHTGVENMKTTPTEDIMRILKSQEAVIDARKTWEDKKRLWDECKKKHKS